MVETFSRRRSALTPTVPRWSLFAGWATHALALFAWAYLGGLALPAAASAHGDHAYGVAEHSERPEPEGPAHHDHSRCSLCALMAAGALAPSVFILTRSTSICIREPIAGAPERPFARADLAIAPPRGPPDRG